ncbi:MAG: DEAD/DEAH box helicase [Candidatus Curtissbacteria bacterium]|nr:DEAD/DEAH box helicase [Candidatus Curtissbacteria bacterium]
MYKQFNQKNRSGNFNRFNSNRFSGNRPRAKERARYFDPTNFITTNSNVKTELTEYTISHSFSDFEISDILKVNISQKGYTIPTPIQDQAIPLILEGRDLVGIANTGTGKTAAFLIPLIEKVAKDHLQKVLIIAPTRELAAQIKDEFIDFAKNLGIYCTLCIGGANMRRQINDLRRNPNFVIGTPGRIQDLLQSHSLNLSGFATVVLDETDRMVDIGFIKDIKYIVSLLSRVRQSLFFSATIGNGVKEILESFVQNPVTISVKTKETAENITQNIIKVSDMGSKVDKLHDLLIQKEFEKVLVFGRTKHGVQRLSDELVKRGFKADAIHGNKRQNQRVKTLEKFKRNELQILVATDVASRGLDIPNVSHVVNYDLPESCDAYIHRIGRTGRADKKGVALTFVN